ncbi:carboxymuconolactone decarboxylase family protein [Ruegeria sp. 2205SS24-7]|uniref:carboxymuconolactone decarboxylase family protein n=1 Tax=Ruegeria discodermiae TaxID=3064389 RepID=UPI0027413DD8|nr:carboxymuconolactone decarboxylase family protein [Ruegeria sp. 2205SS24-7]MDP5217302.1 carboxymuconolactone decarboxylase family protein [Ruegeria sp. 2205SS24-7]
MTEFKYYDEANPPEASKPPLSGSMERLGFVSNLHAVMADSPELLEVYQVVGELFQQSSFDKDELTVIWQTINVEHNCTYCVPGHAAVAKMIKVDDEITNALRDETSLPTERLEALRSFTLKMLRGHGNVANADVETFLAAGFAKQQIFEVILGRAHKMMSNYTNHIANTPIDPMAVPLAWTKASDAELAA